MTREIAAGSGWRVSLADIDVDGAFSTFPGLKRRLALASEGRLTLHGLSPDPVCLQVPGEIVRFDGEAAVSACCHGHAVQAFNLMAEIGAQADLACHRDPFTLPSGVRFFLLPLSGSWRVEAGTRSIVPGAIATGQMAAQPISVSLDGGPGCLVAAVLHAT
ncbi:hypothetical protein HLH27_13705 [Gluconacetobacter takamatsuzukensis]|uniref:Uncharacterized protein n=2 Tax=Gluconacetobacter takamatsuzukensis TaxID=1286190 RepID=A0A7W4PQ84_9PROT|nr:hypothetical protein [Gluconacetobacter takamatsuzukensis]